VEIVNEPAHSGAYSIGAAGSILTVIGILTSGPLSLLVAAVVQPQPPWNGPTLFAESFHYVQTLPFYFGYLLAIGSILMLVSLCVISGWRATSLAALTFTAIGAAFAISN
jgi:ABC-type transport system involved in multi-copper enzyme maturation permease subunit